jgi:hypothetical protein
VLLIDESPQTLLNIRELSGIDAAIRFLQSNRALRVNPDIIDNVRFIYTGSVGLNHTVATIDSTAFINDQNTIEIEPSAQDYLFKQLEWLIPFHIQLLVQEMLKLVPVGGALDQDHVDRAFEVAEIHL